MIRYETKAFRAMGTEIELLAAPTLPDISVEQVQSLFEDIEARFSRFRPDSELSLLNLSAGSPFAASPQLVRVLQEAVTAARDSGGLFDPLILPQVEAAGYRGTIESVRNAVQMQQAAPRSAAYSDIEVREDGIIRLPAGSGLDFGGFAKGWAVDEAESFMQPASDWCINAGGDILARGGGPDGGGWLIGVEDPFVLGRDIAFLRIKDGAVATSSTMRRRWLTTWGEAHHLIDPRTGAPSETDLTSVTVRADTVTRAEVVAKQLLLLGSLGARRHAAHAHIAAIMVDDLGATAVSEWMEDYVVV